MYPEYHLEPLSTKHNFLLLSSVGQIQAHDPVVRLQDGCVGCKVGGGARVRLYVDAPQVGVQAEGAERPFLAQQLDLVNDLCASIVPERQGAGALFYLLTLIIFSGNNMMPCDDTCYIKGRIGHCP